MINISNELNFLILNIRSYISFKIKSLFSFLIYGHYFRTNNFKEYIKKGANEFGNIYGSSALQSINTLGAQNQDLFNQEFANYDDDKDSEVQEGSTTGALDGGEGPPKTPYAFSDGSAKSKKKQKDNAETATDYELVKDSIIDFNYQDSNEIKFFKRS